VLFLQLRLYLRIELVGDVILELASIDLELLRHESEFFGEFEIG